jgi:hypothetical protein
MSVITTIFGCIAIVFFAVSLFSVFVNFFGSLLGMAVGLLQIIILLPWILIEKITGTATPKWVMKFVDAIEWIHPVKWIK